MTRLTSRAVAAGSAVLVLLALDAANAGATSLQTPLPPQCNTATVGTSQSTTSAKAGIAGVLPAAEVGKPYMPPASPTFEAGPISAYYVWSGTAPRGLHFSFYTANTDTKREADYQTLSGTPTAAGDFTVVVSVREDPGAEPSPTPNGNPLTYPNGHPVCERTTERFTLVVGGKPTPQSNAELTKTRQDELAAEGGLSEALAILRRQEEEDEAEEAKAVDRGLASALDKMEAAAKEFAAAHPEEVKALVEARIKQDLQKTIDTVTNTEMKISVEEHDQNFTPSKLAPDLEKADASLKAAAALTEQVM